MKYIVMLAVASVCGYAAINQHQQPAAQVAPAPVALQSHVAQVPPSPPGAQVMILSGVPGSPPGGIVMVHYLNGRFPREQLVWDAPNPAAKEQLQLRYEDGLWVLHRNGAPEYWSNAPFANSQQGGTVVLQRIPIQITGQPIYYGNPFPGVSSVTIAGTP